jgi:hypothetical protein
MDRSIVFTGPDRDGVMVQKELWIRTQGRRYGKVNLVRGVRCPKCGTSPESETPRPCGGAALRSCACGVFVVVSPR